MTKEEEAQLRALTKEQEAGLRAALPDIRKIAAERAALEDQLRDAILDHNPVLMEQLARQLVGLPRQSKQ
jgi:hypothetical protein